MPISRFSPPSLLFGTDASNQTLLNITENAITQLLFNNNDLQKVNYNLSFHNVLLLLVSEL